jgi:hypothetical protein
LNHLRIIPSRHEKFEKEICQKRVQVQEEENANSDQALVNKALFESDYVLIGDGEHQLGVDDFDIKPTKQRNTRKRKISTISDAAKPVMMSNGSSSEKEAPSTPTKTVVKNGLATPESSFNSSSSEPLTTPVEKSSIGNLPITPPATPDLAVTSTEPSERRPSMHDVNHAISMCRDVVKDEKLVVAEAISQDDPFVSHKITSERNSKSTMSDFMVLIDQEELEAAIAKEPSSLPEPTTIKTTCPEVSAVSITPKLTDEDLEDDASSIMSDLTEMEDFELDTLGKEIGWNQPPPLLETVLQVPPSPIASELAQLRAIENRLFPIRMNSTKSAEDIRPAHLDKKDNSALAFLKSGNFHDVEEIIVLRKTPSEDPTESGQMIVVNTSHICDKSCYCWREERKVL